MKEDEATNEMSKRKQGRRSNGCGGVKLRGNTWYARYTDALGIRREVSTHTSSKEEALKVLATYTSPIKESKSQDEIKLRLQQSIDVLELRHDVKATGRVKLSEMVAKFLNHRDLADTTEGTRANYTRHLHALLDALEKVHPDAQYLDDVTSGVADDAMGELTKRFTPSTYNIALATYQRVWGMFARNNPFTKMSKRKVDKSRGRQAIGEDDVRRIFEACRDNVERAVWGVGVYTGLRCGDVCHLNYGAFDKALTTLTVMPQKTKRHMSEPLTIPICPTLRGLLSRVLDWSKIGNPDAKEVPIWPEYKRRYDKSGATYWFARTLNKAGLQTSHIDASGHRVIDTGFHITRHFFITKAGKFMSPLLVQRIVGHSSINMTQHYFHANEDELRDGLAQMPNYTQEDVEVDNARDERDEVLELLQSVKRPDESAMDCLRRLISYSMKMVG